MELHIWGDAMKRSWKYSFVVCAATVAFCWLCLLNIYAAPTNDVEIRAVFDIGSAQTKVRVARYNAVTNSVEEILYSRSITVAYKDDLEKGGEKSFSPAIMGEGMQAIHELYNEVQEYDPEEITAVATAAFRETINGEIFVEDIYRAIGMRVHIIDQVTEGKLTFLAVRDRLKIPIEKLQNMIVWDISGGSFRMITVDEEGVYDIYTGETAAIAFRNEVIANVKGRDPKKVFTPNPFSIFEMDEAREYAREIGHDIDWNITYKILDSKVFIIGVGGLFTQSIYPLVGKKERYYLKELQKAVYSLAEKNDEDLGGGEYASLVATNPLFVLGIMEALHIWDLRIADVIAADGVFLVPELWKEGRGVYWGD